MSSWRLWLLALTGCGVQSVELAPQQADVLLLDGLSADTVTRFARAATDAREDPMLSFLYPSGASALPGNFAPVRFSWEPGKKPGPGAEAAKSPTIFELSFAADREPLRLYTTQTAAALPAERWRSLLAASQDQTLRVQVRSLDAAGKLRVGKQLTLQVWAPLLGGELYYWSDAARQLMRVRSDDWLSEQVPEASQVDCAGCWAIAPDGRQLLEARGDGSVQLRTLADGTAQRLFTATALSTVQSCSLDVLGARALCSGPEVSAWYSADGALGAPPFLGQVGFAPTGQRVAFASPLAGMPMAGSQLREAELLASGELSSPTTLAELDKADESFAAPAYSSDGSLIVFQRSKGPMGKDTSLWLVPAGGGEPLAIDASAKQDSLPTLLQSALPGGYWLAFSSAREHDGSKPSPEQTQLWLWAIRRSESGALEPSEAPLWLPFQSPDDDNQRPQWSRGR